MADAAASSAAVASAVAASSAAAVALEAAATTDWTTYDGEVPQRFMFYAVFFPVVMGVFLIFPAAICYCCLAGNRVRPYTPPNIPGGPGFGRQPFPISSDITRPRDVSPGLPLVVCTAATRIFCNAISWS